MSRSSLILAALAFATATSACDYRAPKFGEERPENVISGSLLVGVPGATGDAVVFVTDAANPMPPLGTGSPATFAMVPPSAFGGTAGLRAADYTVTGVPDGDWMITGLLDVDQDFHPLIPGSALAGATCGDVVGAWVSDLTNPIPTVLSVEGGELADDITVALARQVTTERPAFRLLQPTPLDRASAATNPSSPQGFGLDAIAVHATFGNGVDLTLAGPFDPEAPAACQTGFLVEVPDADGNGEPDPHPTLPAPFFDVSPDIFLEWIPTETDEAGNPLGPDARPLGSRSWASLAVPSPAGLLDGSLPAPGSGPALVPSLSLIWVPGGYAYEDGVPTQVSDPRRLPAGAWSVTTVLMTGQTWSMPNGLAGSVATDASFDPTSQGAVLVMQ